MRWFARPENDPVQLRVKPRPFSMNANNDPEQVRLREYLADTKDLVSGLRIEDRPWALRLDVGAPRSRSLLTAVADLDNYVFPVAKELKNPHLVSVWATKQTDVHERSYVQIADAREGPPPADVLTVRTTASVESDAFKDEVKAAVYDSGAQMLPDGPVRLELSFVIGNRGWLPVWKPTIDALDPLLGRTDPFRAYHPLDGRIVELGMHLQIDPNLGYDVEIGIAPSPWHPEDRVGRRVNFGQRLTCPTCGAVPGVECPTAYGLNHFERMAAFDHSRQLAHELGFGDPTVDSWPDEVLAEFYGKWPTAAWVPEKRAPLTFGWNLFNDDSGQ
jgi:hypothetical protein